MGSERYASPGAPADEVLRAFGVTEKPVRIAGGQGQNYRSGQIVLKPAEDDEETNWIAEFYLSTKCDGFRLPVPRRSQDGQFVFDGWQAWEYSEGQPVKGRWREKVDICIQFHQAIADITKPDYFNRRDQNPWVIADKVTWGEIEIDHHPRIAPAVAQLRNCLRPVNNKSQLIHGDFGGNVMFADFLLPVVIDLSPYWRPMAFAVGVVIADAIVWEGADESLIKAGYKLADFNQYLARAELRRVIELETIHKQYGWDMLDEIDAHIPLVNTICKRCS